MARRFLGIPPPLCADLRVCGEFGQTLTFEGFDLIHPLQRAAHLAACNACPHTAAGGDRRLPSYHFTHSCLRDALASILRESGIYCCIRQR